MKTLHKIAFASFAFLAAVGCEQHDPAVTVPGYAEKQAAKEQGGASAEATPKSADQSGHH
jgi:hypothetical protein